MSDKISTQRDKAETYFQAHIRLDGLGGVEGHELEELPGEHLVVVGQHVMQPVRYHVFGLLCAHTHPNA